MDITNKNFIEKLPELFNDLEKCDFVAFDTEMSGLPNFIKCGDGKEDIISRYERIIRDTSIFTIVQFGLCPVYYDREEETYVAKPYNFYIYPYKIFNVSSDNYFLSDANSLLFLRRNKFDLNKWIDDGIPYLRDKEETLIIEKINDEIEFIEKSMNRKKENMVNTFLICTQDDLLETFNNIVLSIDRMLELNDVDYIDVPIPSERFYRNLIKSIMIRFDKDICTNDIYDSEKWFLRIKPRVCQARINELKDQKMIIGGFCKIIHKLISIKKPLIGHNMLFDLVMSIRQFFRNVPKDFVKFKVLLTNLFPKLYDTKVMALLMDQIKCESSILSDIYIKLINFGVDKNVKLKLDKGFERYDQLSKDKCHEAGYDAFITSCIFLWIMSMKFPKYSQICFHDSNFINKIHISGLYKYKIMDMNSEFIILPQKFILIGIFKEETNFLSYIELLIGYKFEWLNKTHVYIISSYPINTNEMRRVKSIIQCDEIYPCKKWLYANKLSIPPNNDLFDDIKNYLIKTHN